tara:strand:- start:1205 stop:1813 length:609 start_codon:yes stop_codon:yes gene_type:complete
VIKNNKIISVLTIKDSTKALDLAKCLYDSGIVNLDIRLRTSESRKAIELITNSKYEFNIGVGTVLSIDDLNFVKSLGIKYAFSPVTDYNILEYSKQINFNFIPGVSNINDISNALNHKCQFLKYYPAEKSGGILNLNSLINNNKLSELKFIAMGGLNSLNIKPYLNHNNITGIGLSWIADENLIDSSNWNEISRRANLILNL